MLSFLWNIILYVLGFKTAWDSSIQYMDIPEGEILDLTGDVRKCEEMCVHSGEFADIWKVELVSKGPSGGVYAAKVVREIVVDATRRENVAKRLMSVYEMWNTLNRDHHENLVPFYGIVNGFGNFPSSVMPYYKNGNALIYTQNNPNADKHPIIADIAAGLAHLHSRPESIIAHGNLKASNALITDDGRACISDIRFYLVVSQSDFTTANVAGSCRWTAPEIMDPPEDAGNDEDEFATVSSPAADVYSYGMTVLEIYTGKHPFSHKRNDATVVLDVMKGLRPFRPETPEVTDELWRLLQDCWVTEPEDRPTMNNVVVRVDSLKQVPTS